MSIIEGCLNHSYQNGTIKQDIICDKNTGHTVFKDMKNAYIYMHACRLNL